MYRVLILEIYTSLLPLVCIFIEMFVPLRLDRPRRQKNGMQTDHYDWDCIVRGHARDPFRHAPIRRLRGSVCILIEDTTDNINIATGTFKLCLQYFDLGSSGLLSSEHFLPRSLEHVEDQQFCKWYIYIVGLCDFVHNEW